MPKDPASNAPSPRPVISLTQRWPVEGGADEQSPASAWVPIQMIRYVQPAVFNGATYSLVKLWPFGALYTDYPIEKICQLIDEYHDAR